MREVERACLLCGEVLRSHQDVNRHGRLHALRAALDDMAKHDGYGEVEEVLAEWWKAD